MSNLEIKENNPATKVVEIIRQSEAYLGMNYIYDAVISDYTYTENGIQYYERLLTVVQDLGPAFAGMWKNRIDQEIQHGHMKTNSEINHEMYLNLTSQEDYVNPFTNEIDRGSNQWNYRWLNEQGNIVYTDDINYNPNSDPTLQIQGYKLSKVKN